MMKKKKIIKKSSPLLSNRWVFYQCPFLTLNSEVFTNHAEPIQAINSYEISIPFYLQEIDYFPYIVVPAVYKNHVVRTFTQKKAKLARRKEEYRGTLRDWSLILRKEVAFLGPRLWGRSCLRSHSIRLVKSNRFTEAGSVPGGSSPNKINNYPATPGVELRTLNIGHSYR